MRSGESEVIDGFTITKDGDGILAEHKNGASVRLLFAESDAAVDDGEGIISYVVPIRPFARLAELWEREQPIAPEFDGLPGDYSPEKQAAYDAFFAALFRLAEVAPEACHLAMRWNKVDVTQPGDTVQRIRTGRVMTLSGFILRPAAAEDSKESPAVEGGAA